jgi:diguanylate cyclase (GGDEF)-like protein
MDRGAVKSLSLQARIFFLGFIIAGTALLAINLPAVKVDNFWMLLALAGMAAISLIFRVVGASERMHYSVSYLFYGFSLVLMGVPETLLVVLIASLIEWACHRYPWYVQAFNIAGTIVVIQLSGLILTLLNPGMLLNDLLSVVAVIIAMIAFTLTNHLMTGMAVQLLTGERINQSGVFQAFSLLLDFNLLCMGAAATFVYKFNPYASLLSLLPIYLVYTTLRVPALERKSNTDSKTGLFNAEYFSAALDGEMARAIRFDRPLTVVMGDMDLLRNINNTYGHMAGDVVLTGIANIIRKNVREYDIVARFGGEEYAILMPETYPAEAYPRIEAIRQAIENTRFKVATSPTPIQATMTFGIAGRAVGTKSQTGSDITHNADEALFHAKLEGRNRVLARDP